MAAAELHRLVELWISQNVGPGSFSGVWLHAQRQRARRAIEAGWRGNRYGSEP